MNPLDREEFSAFLDIMKKDMPIITNKTFSVKRSFSQGLPKNLKSYSEKIDNEFLNNNLAIIEEINHRNSKHWIPKWFQEYQNKIYGDTDILNKDNFFKAHLHDSFFTFGFDHNGLPKNTRYANHGNAFISFRILNGLPLSTATGTHSGNYTVNNISANKVTIGTGIAGSLYDRLAHSLVTAAGNINLGAYSDDGGGTSQPDVREADTGSITSTADYALKTVTEFSLTTAQQWIATVHDSTQSTNYDASGGANTNYDKAGTVGSLPNPFAGGGTHGSLPLMLKMEHS